MRMKGRNQPNGRSDALCAEIGEGPTPKQSRCSTPGTKGHDAPAGERWSPELKRKECI